MNRVKVWAYAVAVAAVAVAALRAELLRQRGDAAVALDARLAAGAAQVSAATRAVAREASAAAAATARDAKLVQALEAKEPAPPAPLPRKRGKGAPPPQPLPTVDEEAREAALREAARAALATAERTFGFSLPDGTVVTAGNREWLSRKGEPSVAEGEAMGLLRGAIAGRSQRGWIRLNGAVFYAAASPAGEAAGLVVLVPLDEAWVRATGAAIGAEVTLSVPDAKPFSTLRGDAAQPFAGWTFGAGAGTDVGRLGPVALALGPLKVPPLPQPWGAPPAHRARAVALEGLKSGYVVLAIPVSGAPSAAHYLALAAVLGLFLVGVVVGFLVRAVEVPAAIPEALVSVATRIERGDFAARAPALAGRLGTIASALNRAAERAGPAAAAAAMPPPEPFAARPLAPAPSPAAGPPRATAPAAAPATVEVDEEAHWQQVYQDFLRTRASCGEATEGLTYDKFRLKLEGNKAALAAKYGSKSVKFQVYVKDGKAALKATPVK